MHEQETQNHVVSSAAVIGTQAKSFGVGLAVLVIVFILKDRRSDLDSK